MPRPPRPNIAGGVYHVTARGNNLEPVFLDDADRYVYLRMLASVATYMSIRLFAYVLMTNHVHLLWETRLPNVSAAVHRLHGPYARYFNRRHAHWGHVFGQRFYGELITDDNHLLGLSQYIPRNPVRAGLVDDPADYPWSSYPWYVGLTEHSLVDARPVLEVLTRNPDRVPMDFVKALREPIRRGR